MKMTRVLLSAMAFGCALFSATLASADAVDDLLAGKPVLIANDSAAPPESAASDAALDRAVEATRGDSQIEEQSVAETLQAEALERMHASVKDPLSDTATPDTASLNLVPEPSAIALSALSLVYFLIFFRRRYSF